jgi:hypothetical protein
LTPAVFDKFAVFESIGYKPHAGQLAVHRSRAPRRVQASGVRWGKTTCSAMEGLTAMLEPKERSVGWVVGPTYELADKVFREIDYKIGAEMPHRIVSRRINDKKLVIRNLGGGTSEIRAKSADNDTSLLGEGLDWLIVDEAARLRGSVWESHLTQRLIDKKGWAMLISTPKGKGWFYDLFRRGLDGPDRDPDFESWNCATVMNPLIDPAELVKLKASLPDRVYKQEFEAQFLEGSGMVFRNVRDCATGAFEEPKPGEDYYAGLDLAKVDDYTVLTIMTRDRRVVYVDRFRKMPWSAQVTRIKAAVDKYDVHATVVDTTGPGEPIYEALRAEGLFVKSYKFSAKSKPDLINNLSLFFEKKIITIPAPKLWPEGIDELESYEYNTTLAGTLQMSAPVGYFDDCVISLALAAWQCKPSLEPVFAFA